MGHDLEKQILVTGGGSTQQSFIQEGSVLLTAIRVATFREK